MVSKELVERVRAVNAEAAEWLESGAAEELLSSAVGQEELLSLFEWPDAPQGYNYWAAIAHALGEFGSEGDD